MLNYARHPWLPVNMVEHLRDAKLWHKHEKVPAANIFIDRITKAIALAKQAMHPARDRQAKYASGKAREHPFQPGQRVLLSSKNIRIRSEASELKVLPSCNLNGWGHSSCQGWLALKLLS